MLLVCKVKRLEYFFFITFLSSIFFYLAKIKTLKLDDFIFQKKIIVFETKYRYKFLCWTYIESFIFFLKEIGKLLSFQLETDLN